MVYEMKNLFSPGEQGERTDNAFLTVVLQSHLNAERWPHPAVTSEGVGG